MVISVIVKLAILAKIVSIQSTIVRVIHVKMELLVLINLKDSLANVDLVLLVFNVKLKLMNA